jgi:tetratricopeptide (TPR) repeat protein
MLTLARLEIARADLVVPASNQQEQQLSQAVPEFLLEGIPVESLDGAGLAELNAAVTSYHQGDVPQALAKLTAAHKAAPQLPPPRLMLARLMLAAQQWAPGRSVLEQLAISEPGEPGLYLAFAELALQEKRVSDAQLQLRQAWQETEAAKKLPASRRQWLRCRVRAGLAAVAEARQQWELAHGHLEACLKLEPDGVAYRRRLARALFALGETAQAYDQFAETVRQSPSLEPPALSLARLCEQQGDRSQTERWLRQATLANPQDALVHWTFAAWLVDVGRTEEALAVCRRAEELEPKSRDVRLLRGIISMSRKRYGEAQQAFEPLYQQQPGDLEAGEWLALSLAEQPDAQQRDRAVQLATVLVQAQPQSARALATFGWVSYRAGNLQAAQNALQTAASAGQVSSDTAYYLATVLAETDQMQDVTKLLTEALDARGRFLHRAEAEAWLERLSQQSDHTSAVK